MNTPILFRTSILTLGLSLALSAHAQNIVQDGDFEAALAPSGTTTFYGSGTTFDGFWLVGGTTGVGIDVDNGSNLSGHKSVFLDPIGDTQSGPGSISQTLATVVGQSYLVSFDTHNDGPSSFTATFGTASLLTNAQLPQTLSHSSFLVTATSPTTVLSFAGSSTSFASIELDSVSVVAQAVPEPAPTAALGLGALALFRRRRRA